MKVIYMNAMERFEQWCNNPYFDQATRAELRALAEGALRVLRGEEQAVEY